MKLKFIGKNLHEYKGLDGNGGLLHLKRGDSCEVAEKTAKLLLQSYPRDFMLDNEEVKAEHAPKLDKEFKKGNKYKAK